MVVVCASAPANCCAATNQCPYINFFCSPAHAQAWQDAYPDLTTAVMDLSEALAHGRQIFANLLR
jgi:alkylmercury lyase-like protein